ncbi:hypothetical protein DFH11DRAFT_1734313 [Phellopilus nigrolimitatus]|nr:hypothetical protein DFH11DRAFT_1734313 [Phellopilus nigrolimitatus]
MAPPSSNERPPDGYLLRRLRDRWDRTLVAEDRTREEIAVVHAQLLHLLSPGRVNSTVLSSFEEIRGLRDRGLDFVGILVRTLLRREGLTYDIPSLLSVLWLWDQVGRRFMSGLPGESFEWPGVFGSLREHLEEWVVAHSQAGDSSIGFGPYEVARPAVRSSSGEESGSEEDAVAERAGESGSRGVVVREVPEGGEGDEGSGEDSSSSSSSEDEVSSSVARELRQYDPAVRPGFPRESSLLSVATPPQVSPVVSGDSLVSSAVNSSRPLTRPASTDRAANVIVTNRPAPATGPAPVPAPVVAKTHSGASARSVSSKRANTGPPEFSLEGFADIVWKFSGTRRCASCQSRGWGCHGYGGKLRACFECNARHISRCNLPVVRRDALSQDLRLPVSNPDELFDRRAHGLPPFDYGSGSGAVIDASSPRSAIVYIPSVRGRTREVRPTGSRVSKSKGVGSSESNPIAQGGAASGANVAGPSTSRSVVGGSGVSGGASDPAKLSYAEMKAALERAQAQLRQQSRERSKDGGNEGEGDKKGKKRFRE